MSAGLIVSPSNLAAQKVNEVSTDARSVPSAAQETNSPSFSQRVILEVDGMTCASCPKTVKAVLKKIDGVYSVEATFNPPEATVQFNPAHTSVEALVQTTKNAGYPSSPTSNP